MVSGDVLQGLQAGPRFWRLRAPAYRRCQSALAPADVGLQSPEVRCCHSALGTILARASSLRNDVKRSFRESVQNLLSWALNSPDRSTDELMHQIEGMFA